MNELVDAAAPLILRQLLLDCTMPQWLNTLLTRRSLALAQAGLQLSTIQSLFPHHRLRPHCGRSVCIMCGQGGLDMIDNTHHLRDMLNPDGLVEHHEFCDNHGAAAHVRVMIFHGRERQRIAWRSLLSLRDIDCVSVDTWHQQAHAWPIMIPLPSTIPSIVHLKSGVIDIAYPLAWDDSIGQWSLMALYTDDPNDGKYRARTGHLGACPWELDIGIDLGKRLSVCVPLSSVIAVNQNVIELKEIGIRTSARPRERITFSLPERSDTPRRQRCTQCRKLMDHEERLPRQVLMMFVCAVSRPYREDVPISALNMDTLKLILEFHVAARRNWYGGCLGRNCTNPNASWSFCSLKMPYKPRPPSRGEICTVQ